MTDLNFQLEFDKNLVEFVDEVMVDLNNEPGYQVQPYLDGTLLDIIAQVSSNVSSNQEFLKILFGAASTTLTILAGRLTKKETGKSSIKITIEVDGQPLTVEASDVVDATQLIKLFQTKHPEITQNVSPKSKMKLKASSKKSN